MVKVCLTVQQVAASDTGNLSAEYFQGTIYQAFAAVVLFDELGRPRRQVTKLLSEDENLAVAVYISGYCSTLPDVIRWRASVSCSSLQSLLCCVRQVITVFFKQPHYYRHCTMLPEPCCAVSLQQAVLHWQQLIYACAPCRLTVYALTSYSEWLTMGCGVLPAEEA